MYDFVRHLGGGVTDRKLLRFQKVVFITGVHLSQRGYSRTVSEERAGAQAAVTASVLHAQACTGVHSARGRVAALVKKNAPQKLTLPHRPNAWASC